MRADRKAATCPAHRLHREWCFVQGNLSFWLPRSSQWWGYWEKTSFPEKMDPLCGILGKWLGVPKMPRVLPSALDLLDGAKRVQTLLTCHFVQLLYFPSRLRRDHENRNYLVTRQVFSIFSSYIDGLFPWPPRGLNPSDSLLSTL